MPFQTPTGEDDGMRRKCEDLVSRSDPILVISSEVTDIAKRLGHCMARAHENVYTAPLTNTGLMSLPIAAQCLALSITNTEFGNG